MKKDYLVQCNAGKIIGEREVLINPIFDEAFEAILQKYQPKHQFAIFSLCSKCRPFTNSMKWRALVELFGDECDLIVCSNAGIIPLEFCTCYPYMDYDSQSSDPDLSDAHKEKFYSRLSMFLHRFKWKKVVGLFSPYEGAAEVWNNCSIKNGRLFPTPYQYSRALLPEEFAGYSQRFYKLLCKSALMSIRDYFGIRAAKLTQKLEISRSSSLDHILREVVDKDLKSGVGYGMTDLKKLILKRGGHFDDSYMVKVIKVNCGESIKYQLKGHNLLRKIDGLFYKNDGVEIQNPYRKLF